MKFSSSVFLLLPLTAESQVLDTGFGVDPVIGGGLDSGFGVDPPEIDIDPPEIDIDPPEIDPGFGVDPPEIDIDPPEIDPGFGVDPPELPDFDPDFEVDPPEKPEIDPDFGVDPDEIDPDFGVDPNEIDPDFGVDPDKIDPDFGVDPNDDVDPNFGVDPLTDAPTAGVTADAPTTAEPTDSETKLDRDEYGCNPSLGFSWCPSFQECVQPSETACDTIILGDEGSPEGLLPGWTLFDPFGTARLATDTGDCDPTSGEYVQANLDYFQGVNIECDDETSDECQPLLPPNPESEGNFNDKWLVTVFVLATNGRQCPTQGGPLTNNFRLQFYAKDSDGSRSISSRVVRFARVEEVRGLTVDSGGDDGTGLGHSYTSCVKVPLGCYPDDPSPGFTGWTGLSYQNRPSSPDDCQGPIHLYLDSIRVSNACPLDVPDDEDLG